MLFLYQNSQIILSFVYSDCWHSEKTQAGIKDHVIKHASDVSDSSRRCFFTAVEFMTKGGIKTRYGIKFFNENLIFYALPNEASSIGAYSSDECAGTIPDERSQRASPTTEWSTQHSTWEPRLSPGRNSAPSYNAIDFSMKSQEGYYQNPSTITEQTILSSSVNIERMESFDSINPYNLPYSTIIKDSLQPTYLPEHLDFFRPTYTPYVGEFDDGFTFF